MPKEFDIPLTQKPRQPEAPTTREEGTINGTILHTKVSPTMTEEPMITTITIEVPLPTNTPKAYEKIVQIQVPKATTPTPTPQTIALTLEIEVIEEKKENLTMVSEATSTKPTTKSASIQME